MVYQNYSNLQENYKDIVEYCKTLNVGDKIKFASEKQRYTIKAKTDRYLICTKPFNAIKHILYTIIDLERLIRGRNNMYDYMIHETILCCLEELEAGRIEVSHSCVVLDVVKP